MCICRSIRSHPSANVSVATQGRSNAKERHLNLQEPHMTLLYNGLTTYALVYCSFWPSHLATGGTRSGSRLWDCHTSSDVQLIIKPFRTQQRW